MLGLDIIFFLHKHVFFVSFFFSTLKKKMGEKMQNFFLSFFFSFFFFFFFFLLIALQMLYVFLPDISVHCALIEYAYIAYI
jgi:hypothetical protein